MAMGAPRCNGVAIVANAVVVAVVVLLGACDSGSTPDSPAARFSGSPAATAREPLARSTWQPGQSAMAGSIPGTLVMDETGCIRLQVGERLVSLVWPDGWTAKVNGDDVVITEPSGMHSLRTGGPVDLGGGFIGEEQYDAQRCASGKPWQVVGVPFE